MATKNTRLTLKLHGRIVKVVAVIFITALFVWVEQSVFHNLSSHKPLPTNPVPSVIRRSVNFTVYYPEPDKLPHGYYLDTSSFTHNSSLVVYVVRSNSSNAKLIFSVQQKPSNVIIQTFYKRYIPLHLSQNTAIGTAVIGAVASQTIISLPTTGNAWILITVSSSVREGQIKQILQSIRS